MLTFHLAYYPPRWELRRAGSAQAVTFAPSQAAAIELAVRFCSGLASDTLPVALRVHRADGALDVTWTFPRAKPWS